MELLISLMYVRLWILFYTYFYLFCLKRIISTYVGRRVDPALKFWLVHTLIENLCWKPRSRIWCGFSSDQKDVGIMGIENSISSKSCFICG
jgi:hypothetical protein